MGIFDGMLRVLGVLKPKPVPTEPQGVIGTQMWGGYINELERNTKLRGPERYKTFAETTANVSIIGAALRNFLTMVSSVDWKVEPADTTPEAAKLAELVDNIIHDMKTPWFQVVRRAAMFMFYGFSWQEWIAKLRDDGVIGFADIVSRPQFTVEQWDVDRGTGQVLGIVQRDPTTGDRYYLWRSKSVYVVDNTLTDSPDGLGLLRHTMQDVAQLKRYEQLEGYGYETDLRGVPLGWAPISKLNKLVADGDMTALERDDALAGIRNFVQNHVKTPQLGILLDSLTYQDQGEAAVPSSNKQWGLELLRVQSSNLADMAKAVERLIGQIARVLHAEQLLLGAGSKGSFALGKEKYKQFAKMVDSVLTQLSISMRNDLLAPLWDLNGWDKKLMPRFIPDAIQLDDITELATALQLLSQAGAVLMPQDPAVNELRRLMHLSEVPQDLAEQAAAMAQREPGTRGTTQASQEEGRGNSTPPPRPSQPVRAQPRAVETSSLSATRPTPKATKRWITKGRWFSSDDRSE